MQPASDEFKEDTVRYASTSTQAMFEFDRMIQSMSRCLVLTRSDQFWELWFAGDDFGKSQAEFAKLCDDIEGGFIYESFKYGDIKITPDGAIRSLDFGSEYEDLPVLVQLYKFLERDHSAGGIDYSTIYLDLRPQGNMIDVDVKTIEHFASHIENDEFVETAFTYTIATFTYDPTNNLLLHRTTK